MQMTYTIFDGNPSESGPCAWPNHEGLPITEDTPDEALQKALAVAEAEGRECGEYAPGDRLWVEVWDEDGINVASGSVALES